MQIVCSEVRLYHNASNDVLSTLEMSLVEHLHAISYTQLLTTSGSIAQQTVVKLMSM